MPSRLLVTEGPNKGQSFDLPEGQPFVLGRGRQTVTRLVDPHVSREHCQVIVKKGFVVVRDLGSSGGTFVNGQRVTEKPLFPGDRIQLGETSLVLHADDVPDLATLPPGLDVEATLPPRSPVPQPAPVPPPEPPGPNPARPLRFQAKKPARPRQQPPALPANRLAELSGSALAHFHLGPVIARGLSGILFQALDLEKNKPVALKVFLPEFARHEVAVRRFIRAMRTMMPLRHPNLVGVFGAGKKGPYCWVAMELIAGESLHEMIVKKGAAGMLDWRHAFRVAQHIGRALEFAHDRNIIHRNITPRNVLVRAQDRTYLLGDLMLARALEGKLAEELTGPGEMLGEIRYMSPERTRGTEKIDGRSDLYSLGALLYTMLAGQPPFEGYTVAETVMQIRQQMPELPRKFQPGIPSRFQEIVMTLLAKGPESRYQKPRDMLTDLDSFAKLHDVRG